MKEHDWVLSIQDTCFINYTHHPSKEDLGEIGTTEQGISGLVMHGSLVTTLEGLPLGRLSQTLWARPRAEVVKATKRRTKRIEDKESYKWLESLRESVALTPRDVDVIQVCDRESDIYEFFAEAQKLQAWVLVRASQNRVVFGEEEADKLWSYMDSVPAQKVFQILIPRKKNQAARKATVEMRYKEVEVKRPVNGGCEGIESLELTAIWLIERHPPKGAEGIQWMLLTNLLVETNEMAFSCVKWYQTRWQIEVYHRILKSGCKIEDCRLETRERIIRYVTLMSIIGWRIFWMTYVGRVTAEERCTEVLAEHEWKALYCHIHKKQRVPKKVPTVYEAMRWIARLGGFLGRRSDGEPGTMSIWRGWQRLTDIAETWLILSPIYTCG